MTATIHQLNPEAAARKLTEKILETCRNYDDINIPLSALVAALAAITSACARCGEDHQADTVLSIIGALIDRTASVDEVLQ